MSITGITGGKGIKPPGAGTVRLLMIIGVVVALLLLGTCTVRAVGTVIQPGDVGVKIRTLGPDAGVDESRSYPSGWNIKGLGERFVEFPVIERTYAYTHEKNVDGIENEEVQFADSNALQMTGDVQLVIAVDPNKAPALYKRWRLTFDQLLETPIRNDVRTAISAETEKVPVTFLYSGGRQEVIHRALSRVQAKWEPQGVHITQLDWIGPIRYPDVVTQAIQATTKANADKTAAEAGVAVANANADKRIAEARGLAESTRLQGEALRANPEVLRQKEIERWNGICPLNTRTCIVGGGVTPQIQVPAEDGAN
ncbi:MAG: band 7 protein [Caulobacter sp.]|nr:band 7 protein [Caulobacter sp.]